MEHIIIIKAICFPGRRTNVTRDTGVSCIGKHISLKICVSHVGENTPLRLYVSQVEKRISRICVFWVGEHISLGICVSQVREDITIRQCIS